MADKTTDSQSGQKCSILHQEIGFKVWEQLPHPESSHDVPTSSTPTRRHSNRGQKRRYDVTRDSCRTNGHGKQLMCSTPIRNTRVNEQGKCLLRIKKTIGKSGNKRRGEHRVQRANRTVDENTQVCDSRVTVYRELSATMCDTRSSTLSSDISRREPLRSLDNSRREPLRSIDNCFVLRSEEDSIASGVSFIFSINDDSMSLATNDTMTTDTPTNGAPLATDTRHKDARSLTGTTFMKSETKTCPDLLGEDEERAIGDQMIDFLDNVYKGSLLKTYGNLVKDDNLIVRWC